MNPHTRLTYASRYAEPKKIEIFCGYEDWVNSIEYIYCVKNGSCHLRAVKQRRNCVKKKWIDTKQEFTNAHL